MPAFPYRARATLKYKTPPGQSPAFAFAPGAELTVLGSADDDGDWLEGELDGDEGKRGVFPASFVEPLPAAANDAQEEEGAPAPAVPSGEEEHPAHETVDKTPQDDSNVAEGSEATPAEVSVKPDEVDTASASASASTAKDEPAQAPPRDETTARAPSAPVDEPTLKDVTPAPAPAPPAPSDVPTHDAQAEKSAPPPPAKKPNALASRIAAFNAAATAQKPEAPPVPRAKPREWKRPAGAAAPPAPAPAPAPAAAAAAPEEPVYAPSTTDAPAEQKDFSAQDAADAVSRGGGSLRDRIKLLQQGGGGAGVRAEAPPPPGHAPKPKPWKRAEPEPAAEEEEDAGAREAHALEDAVVKDERPGEEETTAQSPGAEVPGFEPAEATPAAPRSEAGEDAGRETVERTPKDRTNVVEGGESIPAEASVDKPAVETEGAPAPAGDKSSARAPSKPVVQPSLAGVTPTAPASAEDDDDPEAAKRAALAQRMAGLGGQRMGVPMPALPKRAAGPRARKAKSPAGDAAPSAPVPAPAVVEERAEVTAAPAEEKREEEKPDVLASMGGASAILAQDDEDDEPAKAPVDDEDDFDTPAPPARAPSPPPAPAAEDGQGEGKIDKSAELEDPPLAADEEPLAAEEYVQREQDDDAEQPTIAEEAVAALPDSAATDSGESLSPPALRPPVPPPFMRQETDAPAPGPPTASVPTSGLTPRTPPPPSRPVDPPALASGPETITDESRPKAHAPEAEGNDAPPPLPRGRPPVPSTQQTCGEEPTQREEQEEEGAASPAATPQHPPIPTHPPPVGAERVTTAAEDALIAEMPEIVTPPEEAFDESTAAPELDAPSTGTIAQGRVEGGHETADMAQPAWGKVEGTQTPAAVERPDPLGPGAPPPPAMLKAALGAVEAERAGDAGESGQKSDEADGDEEEEEEDPEVARRRALAARMAKLGGRGMMPPMFGGFGGAAVGGPKKTSGKKKPTSELAEEGELRPRVESRPVESESGSEEPVPHHPPRRIGGIPAGGFALPGIATSRPQQQDEDEDGAQQHAAEQEQHGVRADSIERIKEKSDAATDEAFERHSASSQGDGNEARDDVEQEQEEQEEHDEPQQDEQAPPPLPPNRPTTLPPSRSVPVPPPGNYADPAADVDEDDERVLGEQAQHFDEPESFAQDEPAAEEESEMAPPPPPRPAGGHQASLPFSPPLPSAHAVPSSPPLRAPPSPNLSADLTRTDTQTSRRSSAFAAPPSARGSFDVERFQGGPVGGPALARDVDLDTAGVAWWRSQGGLPSALRERSDVLVDVSESTSTKRGKTRIEKEIEVIYSDYSKTLITVSFAGDDLAEATTSITQAHFPPAAIKSNPALLQQWSSSLGAQVFAAAHAKVSEKGARGLTDRDLLAFCYGRATDPMPPVGGTYGAKVYEATVEQGKKAPMVGEDDEPRAGDVVAIHAKFKHNLTSKTVGSASAPHVAIVAGWDAKKGKLRVIEVDGKSGSVDEGSYRVDEMRAGALSVYRVVPRDAV